MGLIRDNRLAIGRWILRAVYIVSVALVLLAWIAASRETTKVVLTFTPSASATVPSPTPTVTRYVHVPNVTGISKADAFFTLQSMGLTGEVLHYVWSQLPADTVLDQALHGGLKVTEGTLVQLTVAKRLPLVPAVVGKDRWTAGRQLKRAGFDVKITFVQTTAATDGTVLSQTPNGQTPARPRSVVLLNVATVPCTPGYSPCLPLGPSDYDCLGGTGDGPAYAGPERVTGSDPYGLDGDNNGWACALI
jgi:hypothetical protein